MGKMRKLRSKLLFIGGTAAVVVGLAATASAAVRLETWSVSPGGSITLTGGKATFTDSTTTWPLHCQSSASGSLISGSDRPGKDIGSITKLTFATCAGPGKTAYTITAHLPWRLDAVGYNSTKGVSTLQLEGVHITFSSSACSGTLDGTSATAQNGVFEVNYINSTHDMYIRAAGGTLKAYKLRGCTGLFQNGDRFTLATTFAVTPKQTITGTKVGG
jgi:hypothetical protein